MKKNLLFASALALVLGSCSKDATETGASAGSANGKVTAEYVVGNVTRTHLDDSYAYRWDAGDMIGIFGSDDTDVNAPFKNTSADATRGVFDGDLDMTSGESYIGYYPYAQNAAFVDNKINLTIASVQNYSHKLGGDTFAPMAAPALAYGTANEDKTLNLQFMPVAAYLRIPIVGYGTIKTLKLEVDGCDYLAGTGAVDLLDPEEWDIQTQGSDKNPALTLDSGESYITLNCGGAGVELDMDVEKSFWFVIPAGVDFAGKKMTLTINGDDNETLTKTFAADSKPSASNTIKSFKTPLEYAPSGVAIINNEDDFIKYAYEATETVNTQSDDARKFYNEDGSLKKALIIKPLAFDLTKYDDYLSKTEEGSYDRKVADWVVKGGRYAIPTIGSGENGKAYAIEGANKDITVSGLSVAGNGIFGGSNASTVKNITLVDLKVDASQTEADVAALVAVDPKSDNVTLSGVTVSGNPEIKAPENAAAVILGTAYSNKEQVDASDVDMKYADTFDVVDLKYTMPAWLVNNFNHIYARKAATVVTIDDETFATETARDFVELIREKTAWFSVIANGTNYWTGLCADEVNDDDLFSAEELAYVVKTRKAGEKDDKAVGYAVALTCDIDLIALPWVVTDNSLENFNVSIKIDGGKDMFSVENVEVSLAEDNKSRNVLSVFGYGAAVKNLTVKNVVIDASNLSQNTYVSGLAYSGSVNNVTVSDVHITGNAKVVNAVGGMLASTGSITDAHAEGITISEVTTVPYGDIAGRFNLAASASAVISKATTSNKIVGQVYATVPVSVDSENMVSILDFKDCDGNYPAKSDVYFYGKDGNANNYTVRVSENGTELFTVLRSDIKK